MKRISALIILVVVLFVTSYGQDPQPPAKKKSATFDMNDAKPAPKEEPKKDIKATNPTTPATPSAPVAPATPAQPTAPVDPRANWPEWAKIQAEFLSAYLQSQLNGQDPNPYFYYGNSMANQINGGTRPVYLRAFNGFSLLTFEGDVGKCLWRINIDAPVIRGNARGLWFAVVTETPSGDGYKVFSMSRTIPEGVFKSE